MTLGFSKAQQLHKREKVIIEGKVFQVSKHGTSSTKKRKPLKMMSKKAKMELKIWTAVKKERVKLLEAKFYYVPCELCGKPISWEGQKTLEGHHSDHDRRNNELDNCRILHRVCNQRIEDENIKDVPSLL